MNMTLTYFDPDIWGTVSDWFMVIITAITAFYLYKTLQSQKTVQETQNKLFEIETIRFRESIKPVFKFFVPHIDDRITATEENETIHTIAIENQTDSTALEISIDITCDTTNLERLELVDNPKRYLKKNEVFNLLFLVHNNSIERNFAMVSIDYQDIYKTKYNQRLFCIFHKTWVDIHPSLAEIVND